MSELKLVKLNKLEKVSLSTDQYRIWFLHQLNESLNHFNINFAFKVKGALNVELFRLAIWDLVARHDLLHTNFLSNDGIPYLNLIPLESFDLDLTIKEIKGDYSAIESDIRIEMNELGKVPFKLDQGPMFRVRLYKLNDIEFRILFTIHHIIADYDSLKLIMKELFYFYRVQLNCDEIDLLPLKLQFSDYAFWQNERLRLGELRSQLEYWKKELDGELPILKMPMDRPRGSQATNNGATKRITFSQNLTVKLKEISKQNSVTLFVTLISAYQILLNKYTNQEYIHIGTPITTRNKPELKSLIGLFINTLILKSDLSGNLNFIELLQRNRKIAFSAFARQDIPYEKLVSEIKPDRNLNHNLFFQTMVMFLEPENIDHEMAPGIFVEPFEIDKKTTTFELTLSFSYIGECLTLLVDYNTDLYDEETIVYFLQRFEVLLEKLTDEPNKEFKSHSLLKKDEEKEILESYTGIVTNSQSNKNFNQIWTEVVRTKPDNIALIYEKESLTYKQVEQKVNILFSQLVEKGIKPGSLVPVLAKRNLEMIVAFLAILRCGAAYVPLNPKHPADRLLDIISQCKSDLVLSSSEGYPNLINEKFSVLTVKSLLKSNDYSGICYTPILHPLDLAYVIFTSGSTGTPKGVMVSHDSLINHCENMIDKFNLSDQDRVLQFTSPSFDVSVQEIFPTLMQGATLVLWDHETIEGTEAFFSWLKNKNINILNLTTAHWNNLVLDAKFNHLNFPENLKLVIVGGEKVSAKILSDWCNIVQGKIKWINDYGLTETTVTASMYTHTKPIFDSESVPIGTTLNNVAIYVLDERMNPVAKGIFGNIYVGGRGVALGYYGNPQLTKEKFLRNPFKPGRLFSTGDIGRICLDGTLEFDSRDDQQVKIRGNRVELGEIEKQLYSCTGVKKVYLRVIQLDGHAQNSIAAYVVLNDSSIQAKKLKKILEEKLPEYMVPSYFIILEDFPLTSNGKIDQKLLPLPKQEFPEVDINYISAKTNTEKQLIILWEQLLNRKNIGTNSSFFDIGGDSLIATTLISRIKTQFGIVIPLRILFEKPKLSEFAARIDEFMHGLSDQTNGCLIRIQNKGNRLPIFYVHPVGGTVSCYFNLSRSLGDQQPFYALQAYAMTHRDYSVKTIEDLAKLYFKEIREVQPNGPYRLGGWSMGGFIAYEIAKLLKQEGEEVIELSMIDTYLTKTRVMDEKTVLFNFVLQLSALPGKYIDESELIKWKDKEFSFSDICSELKKSNLVPRDTPDEYISHLFNVYMATVEAFKKYNPNPKEILEINKVVLFRAKDSHEELGIWPKLVNNINLHHIDADHFGVVHHASVAEVLKKDSYIYENK